MDRLNEDKIEKVVRKWLNQLPTPFTKKDADFGIRHDLSILQAEFSLTRYLTNPITGDDFLKK